MPAMGYAGQAVSPAAGATAPQSVVAETVTASGLLKPALEGLRLTLGGLKLEKWKGGSVRTEAGTNIASIQRDLQGTLAGLLADADAAPGSVSKLLAVSQNVDALYDVLVRVVDGARIAGTGEQVDRLQLSMADLEKARVALDERIEALAAAQEKQVAALQTDLANAQKAQAAPVCPVVAASVEKPVVAAPRKKIVKKKPTATPATAAAPPAKPAAADKPKP